jgi:hypothetical protein
MDEGLERAVEIARDQIKALEIATRILELLDGESPKAINDGLTMTKELLDRGTATGFSRLTRPTDPSRPAQVVDSKKPRKDLVADYLRSHGPSLPRDIMAETGIPQGTLSWVLADKKRFVSTDGRWSVVVPSRSEGFQETEKESA